MSVDRSMTKRWFLLILLEALFVLMIVGCAASLKPPAEPARPQRDKPVDPFAQAKDRAEVAESCALSPAYFPFDSSDLDIPARTALEQSARCLRQKGLARVHVVGMTDPRGTEEYNLALGERRAQACKKYLVAIGTTGEIQASSTGEEMAAGDDEQGWARDRRAELK
jgi:outer membrane protein OmpA-like peptidoglycan-associated protein